MCLRCLCFRFPFPFAESPWGLPVVADGPASLAKAVMAELAGLKLENKPWPGGKPYPPAGGTGWWRPGALSLQKGTSAIWESGGLAQAGGTLLGWGIQRLKLYLPDGPWGPACSLWGFKDAWDRNLVSRGLAFQEVFHPALSFLGHLSPTNSRETGK